MILINILECGWLFGYLYYEVLIRNEIMIYAHALFRNSNDNLPNKLTVCNVHMSLALMTLVSINDPFKHPSTEGKVFAVITLIDICNLFA